MRHAVVFIGVLVVVGAAGAAAAQSIAGTVRDESGAVLPGVTLEANGPCFRVSRSK